MFKFRLTPVEDREVLAQTPRPSRRRAIPTWIKIEVWCRDEGRCVECGATEDLHFDHVLPFVKGGTSLKSENVQLLCAYHNLSKGDRLR
ncbi:HNH endonuclease [Deinococcus alpinitundrae]|uniref:HNH endonuclease n=1 Tax=Deinococcus alpinitundrae TaxID=468913 RepID=UPI0034D2BC56